MKKRKKVERVGTFSQVGRSLADRRTGDDLKKVLADSVHPAGSSPADELGYVRWGFREVEVGGQ